MDAQKLGTFIATMRKEKGLTQRDLADKLHVTDKAVSKWERGLGLPDIRMIEPLADALGVTVVEVMSCGRISHETIPADQASKAVSNAIDLVAHYRALEKRNTVIMCLSVAAIAFSILLIDSRGIFSFVMFHLPVYILPGIGIALLISSFRRWYKKLPFATTLALALAAFLYPLALFLLLKYSFALGGPIPN